jgi:outer membrane protein OmpA-like peptidoglycan-associated protein
MVYNTDPLNKDSDGDGLTDGEEVKKYKTNPLKADSDEDELNDLDELRKYKTDPVNPDSDGDSLSDGDEVIKYKTNPLERDSDNDTINDADEILKYKTNPNNADSDNDNLKDQDELFVYKTDPLKKDTDGGSVDDGVEVKRGTDPLNPDDDIMKIGKAVVLKGITFEFNSAAITPESEQTLLEALEDLKNNPDITVEIAGHTDEIGSDEYNRKLSLMRADAVKQWLTKRGIQDNRLKTTGYGKDKPVAPNDTPENRKLNRRIEFIRLK